MNRKTNLVIIASLLLILCAVLVNAAPQSAFEGIFNAADKIGLQKVFTKVSDSNSDTVSLNAAGYGFVRFILIILLFTIYYYGLSFAFKDKKNIGITLAICISLLSVFAMPNVWLEKIFVLFGWMGPLIIFLGLMIAGFYLQKKFIESNILAGFFLIFMAIMLFILVYILGRLVENLHSEIGWLEGIALIAAFIYLIVGLIKLFGGLGGTRSGGDGAQGTRNPSGSNPGGSGAGAGTGSGAGGGGGGGPTPYPHDIQRLIDEVNHLVNDASNGYVSVSRAYAHALRDLCARNNHNVRAAGGTVGSFHPAGFNDMADATLRAHIDEAHRYRTRLSALASQISPRLTSIFGHANFNNLNGSHIAAAHAVNRAYARASMSIHGEALRAGIAYARGETP